LEEQIAALTKQKAELETSLYLPETYANKNKFIETETLYKKVSDDLVNKNFDYEKLFEKIMEVESQ
jgi:ATP-binding cassette subfamily F protein 3